MLPEGARIAVVGSGAAGLSAAFLLQRRYEVLLLEKQERIGGHVHTTLLPDGPDAGLAIDSGFIVYNDRNYPTLNKLFDALGIEGQKSNMSFSFFEERSGFQYNGSNLRGLFSQRRHLLSPRFHRFIREILRFNQAAKQSLEENRLQQESLQEFLQAHAFSPDLIHRYIIPMGAAIWSTDFQRMLDFPAAAFLRFFNNHGLLDIKNRPQWYTVKGGSSAYVKKILETFRGEVRSGVQINSIIRQSDGVRLRMADGSETCVDHVVLAAHANESLALLADPSPEERELLGAWNYSSNEVVMHTDASAMPSLRRSWASWNVIQQAGHEGNDPVCLSYHMNGLQNLNASTDYFVTLNGKQPLHPSCIIMQATYTHPVYEQASMATQSGLARLLNQNRSSFCGSYFGYGFHEDAVRSGFQVAQALGVDA